MPCAPPCKLGSLIYMIACGGLFLLARLVPVASANGAGKSTIMRLLLGLLSGEGQITVGGLPQTKLIASHDLDMILDTDSLFYLLSCS